MLLASRLLAVSPSCRSAHSSPTHGSFTPRHARSLPTRPPTHAHFSVRAAASSSSSSNRSNEQAAAATATRGNNNPAHGRYTIELDNTSPTLERQRLATPSSAKVAETLRKLREIEAEQAKPGGDPLELYVNPVTGERGGPRGPEPTRHGDYHLKGRCTDF